MTDVASDEILLGERLDARAVHEARVAESAGRKAQKQAAHQERVAAATALKAKRLVKHEASSVKKPIPAYRPPRVKKLVKMSKRARVAMCEAQNWRCPDCGKVMDFDASDPDDYPTVEHVIPVTLGGADQQSNMAITCFACNQKNGAIISVMPEYKALEFAMARAGIEDMDKGFRALARDQADELIRLRSNLRFTVQDAADLRQHVKDQKEKIRHLKNQIGQMEREMQAARKKPERKFFFRIRSYLANLFKKDAESV